MGKGRRPHPSPGRNLLRVRTHGHEEVPILAVEKWIAMGHSLLGELEDDPYAQLRYEGNADGGAGPKEISQCTSGDTQLVGALDWFRRRAGGIETNARDVSCRCLNRWYRQRDDAGNVIRAWIIAVEKVDEFRKGPQRPAFCEREWASDMEIGLHIRRAAKLIEGCGHCVDCDPLGALRSGDRERSRTLCLHHGAQLHLAGHMPDCPKHRAMPDIFARGGRNRPAQMDSRDRRHH